MRLVNCTIGSILLSDLKEPHTKSVKHRRYSQLLLLAIIVGLISGCSSRHPLTLTRSELVENGFYAYVLPQDESSAYGWSETLRIWSWDLHCKGIDPIENTNPVYILYTGETDPSLEIMIGPWNVAWNENRTTQVKQIDTEWAESGTAEYYEIDGYIKLKFTDVFGFPVQISTGLPITELVSLVERLEYVGPAPDTVSDPWGCGN